VCVWRENENCSNLRKGKCEYDPKRSNFEAYLCASHNQSSLSAYNISTLFSRSSSTAPSRSYRAHNTPLRKLAPSQSPPPPPPPPRPRRPESPLSGDARSGRVWSPPVRPCERGRRWRQSRAPRGPNNPTREC